MTPTQSPGRWRIWIPAFLIAVSIATLVGRLVQLQILEHAHYQAKARDELDDEKLEYGRRGAILDSNGDVLATSIETYDVFVSGRKWQDPAVALPAAAALAPYLKTDAPSLLAGVATGGDTRVARDIDFETGEALKEAIRAAANPFADSVRLERSSLRSHPNGDVAASILGWFGDPTPDDDSKARKVGRSGLEASLDRVLAGRPMRQFFERDVAGEAIPIGLYQASAVLAGADLKLTIDRRIQALAERQLDIAVAQHKAIGGTIVIMEPNTGRILALATSPRLKYSELPFTDSEKVVLENDHSVSYAYEPGSVMKVITMASALDGGAVTPETTYHDDGVVRFEDGTELSNWRGGSYGTQTMIGVLQNSINTGAIFAQRALGRDRFLEYLGRFGFNDKTGIELLAEAAPYFRQPGDEGWTIVDVATQAYGQGIFVTPIQMVAAFTAAINGGTLFRPQLVQATIDPDGTVRERKPNALSQPIRPETSATVRFMLEQVVMPPERGHQGRPRDYTAGGKSGTANIISGNSYDDKRQVASFIGFAPLVDPRIVVLVKLDENADLQTGQEAAGPVFATLVDEVLRYLNVAPDNAAYVGVTP